MTVLTHQLTSRTMVATAFLAAAVLGLIAALVLGVSATSARPASGQSGRATTGSPPIPGRAFVLGATSPHPVSGRATSGSQLVYGPGYRQPGCLVCAR